MAPPAAPPAMTRRPRPASQPDYCRLGEPAALQHRLPGESTQQTELLQAGPRSCSGGREEVGSPSSGVEGSTYSPETEGKLRI